MAEDLSAVSMSVVLADPSGRILDRTVADAELRGQLDSVMLSPGFRYGEDDVGTNVLGISLLKSTPVVIAGDEHFVDVLHPQWSARQHRSSIRQLRSSSVPWI